MKRNVRQHFIGIGVPKSATRWIFECLNEHPDVCASRPKETHFFLEPHSDTTGYAQYFSHCKAEPVTGEFSPRYLYSDTALNETAHHYPNARLIVCLRNPVDRLISRILFNQSRGQHRDVSLEATIEKMLGNQEHEMMHYGRYASYLQRWLAVFPRKQVLILIYEDIEKDPRAFIQRVYQFVGADVDFTPSSLTQRKNVTLAQKYYFPQIRWLISKMKKRAVQSRYRHAIVPMAKALGIQHLFRGITALNKRAVTRDNILPDSRKQISQALRERVYAYYRSDTENLESLLGRTIAEWRP